MSMGDERALGRFREMLREDNPSKDANNVAFLQAGESAGFPWYRLYLAEFLTKKYSNDGEKSQELLPWFILHLAMQAAAGHMRSALLTIADDMLLWYLDDGGKPPPGLGRNLPERLAEALPVLIEKGLETGLWGYLPSLDAPSETLSIPRPPIVLSADGLHAYFLRRRREEDCFLELLARRSSFFPQEKSSKNIEKLETKKIFPLCSSLPDNPAGSIASMLAKGRRLVILAGGPGTGKTTTIATILSLLIEGREEAKQPPLAIGIAAPTGRAATRIMESLENKCREQGFVTNNRFPQVGQTLHKLLGIAPGRTPRHHEEHPLPYDLIIVDEASMLDLSTMLILLKALDDSTALVLVGDPEQLPSIEAGALLGDLLAGTQDAIKAKNPSPFQDAVLQLTKVYRSNKAILEVAKAVNEGDEKAFSKALLPIENTGGEGLHLRPLDSSEQLAKSLAQRYSLALQEACLPLHSDPSHEKERLGSIFKNYTQFAVLSPLRQGLFGVEGLNNAIGLLLRGKTSPFPGMPLMITRNDASRRLWNGDRGIFLDLGGKLRAVFSEDGGYRALSMAILPAWESAWVQTIHKSQGSEFDEVAVILPERAGRFLTRAMLYTAITRAKNRVELYANPETLSLTLGRVGWRNSRIRHWAATSLIKEGENEGFISPVLVPTQERVYSSKDRI